MMKRKLLQIVTIILVIGASCLNISPVNAEYFNGQAGYASVDSSGTSNSYLIIGTSDTSSYQSISVYIAPVLSITNSPISIDFGIVMPSTTYYAYNQSNSGGYSNPVTSAECYFTITNTGSSSCNIALNCSNASGGNAWTLVASNPTGDQFKVIAVYNGEDPASGLVLTNANQAFYTGLAASATLLWDFKEILGGTGTGKAGTFSDSAVKTYTILITGS
jgi:hypothetical protein